MFVNHTNHAAANWSAEQRAAAEILGEISDLPFPEIPPAASELEVAELAEKNLREILNLEPAAVLCQGEFNYTFALVSALKEKNIPVLAATSERVSSEIPQPDGSTRKVSVFRFVRFRRY
ncbi:MAG: CRISPR-associated protein [Selenomonadaceae bacterium]|nr:CRISPR-associated protein [Selenomonadaceae bacterium]